MTNSCPAQFELAISHFCTMHLVLEFEKFSFDNLKVLLLNNLIVYFAYRFFMPWLASNRSYSALHFISIFLQFFICNDDFILQILLPFQFFLLLLHCCFVSGGHHSQSGALCGVLWVHDSSQPPIQTCNSATQSHRFLHHTYA